MFPVPDGDTGTNMSLTLQAAADALSDLPEGAPVSHVARAAYEAAMLGARGNSGVILSQLLRGFSSALAQIEQLTPHDLAAAFSQASEVAYSGVSKPVEGTILTVVREMGEGAVEAANKLNSYNHVLAETVKAAKASSGDREVCPKCGRPNARIIGRSESFPVLYLRCDGCSHTSVAPA